MQKVQKSNVRMSFHSIQRMERQFLAQLQSTFSRYDNLQSQHGSGTILSDGVFEKASQTDAKQFRTCIGSLRVQSLSIKSMYVQYHRLIEKLPVDKTVTYRWAGLSNLAAATKRLVVAAQDQALWTQYY